MLRWPLRSACTSFFVAALRVLDTPGPCHFKTCLSLTLYPLQEFVLYYIYPSMHVNVCQKVHQTLIRTCFLHRLLDLFLLVRQRYSRTRSNFDHTSLSTPRWHCAARNHFCGAQAIEMNGFQRAALHMPNHM